MIGKRAVLLVATAAVLLAAADTPYAAFAQKGKEPEPAAVERARKTVRMLDDVYKTAVVLITDKYVHTKKDHPAGRAAVAWFKQISDKGWHEVRLIDATGQPYSAKNVAKDDFDKEGIKQLLAGKAFFDRVEHKDGKAYLRAITPVPVVMPKCALCHDHYNAVPKGTPIGALTYTIPIE